MARLCKPGAAAKFNKAAHTVQAALVDKDGPTFSALRKALLGIPGVGNYGSMRVARTICWLRQKSGLPGLEFGERDWAAQLGMNPATTVPAFRWLGVHTQADGEMLRHVLAGCMRTDRQRMRVELWEIACPICEFHGLALELDFYDKDGQVPANIEAFLQERL